MAIMTLPTSSFAQDEKDLTTDYADRTFAFADKSPIEYLCSALLLADYDLLDEKFWGEIKISDLILPNSDEDRRPACSVEADAAYILADIEPVNLTVEPSLGADIIEWKNKWSSMVVDGETVARIPIFNPYPVDLTSIIIDFIDGDCDAMDFRRYRVTFEEPIASDDVAIVEFKSPVQDMKTAGCLNVLAAGMAPVENVNAAVGQLVPMARVGQWKDAALLSEVIGNSGGDIPQHILGQLEDSIMNGVRPLPAKESIKNYEGYAALTFLDSQNSEYKLKRDRYFVESKDSRLFEFIRDMFNSMPIVMVTSVFEGLASDRTRIQRDTAWAGYKDKAISVFGKVYDVRPSGFVLPAQLIINTPEGNQATCFLKDFLEEPAMNLEVGSGIACTGLLDGYNILFNIVNLSVTEAEFTETEGTYTLQ